MQYYSVWSLLLLLPWHALGLIHFQNPFLGGGDSSPSLLLRKQSLQLKAIYHHGPQLGSLRWRPVATTSAAAAPDGDAKHPKTHIPFAVQPTLDRYHRPQNTHALKELRNRGGLMRWQSIMSPMAFDSIYGPVPDVTDRDSVLAFAIMCNNAYTSVNESDGPDWYDLGEPWKVASINSSFGWESDGIRGHVFGNEDESLLILAIKGTSAGLWTGGPTGDKDKRNDNILFSCCCGRISRAWQPVCDCYVGNKYECDTKCLEDTLLKEELYYDHALELYKHLSDMYPHATIWITGHSLGGALASMVGQTFGVPTITFEAPGDQLASSRLHLPHPPGAGRMPLWHFGHTGDPIFVGVCTGPMSSCWYGGFAMETRCHTGKTCVWDTVNKHGWRVDIRSHRVQEVIENILKKPDEFPLPECAPEPHECEDCGLWEFYDNREQSFVNNNDNNMFGLF